MLAWLQTLSPIKRARLAALFGALAVVAAFPTVGWVLPVLVAWPWLLAESRQLTWKRRFSVGWLMGFVYTAILFRWVGFTLEVMTNFPTWLGVLCVLAFAAWHGLHCGIFLALAEPARRAAEARLPGSGPFAIAAVFVAAEYLWPMLFPWTMGHAFWMWGPVHASAALFGIEGLAFLVPLLAASTADLVLRRGELGLRRILLPPALSTLVIVGFGVGWYLHVHGTEPRRTLRAAVVQVNWSLEDKRKMTYAVRTRLHKTLRQQIEAIPKDTYDLIVISEGAFPFQWNIDADRHRDAWADGKSIPFSAAATIRIGDSVAKGPGTDTIVGGLRMHSDGNTRNAAVHFGADGRIRGHYDKQVLVAFSEYMPGRSIWPELKDAISGVSDFYPGDTPCRFEVAGETLGCGICYETIFADDTRADIGEASVLLNFTIDTWFGRSTAPWMHLMIQTTRAAELGVPLLRSTLTGISAVVGPDGVLTHTLGFDEAGLIDVEVPLRDLSPPYRSAGPWFRYVLLLSALFLVADAFRRRRELFPAGVVDDSSTRSTPSRDAAEPAPDNSTGAP